MVPEAAGKTHDGRGPAALRCVLYLRGRVVIIDVKSVVAFGR